MTATVALLAAGLGAPLARADVGSEPVVEPQAVVDAALAAVATVPVPSAPAEPEESVDAPTAAAPAPVVPPATEPPPSGSSPDPLPSPASATDQAGNGRESAQRGSRSRFRAPGVSVRGAARTP